MMYDFILSVVLIVWVVWLGCTTPYVVRRASDSMSRAVFELFFGQIVKLAACLFALYGLFFGVLSWRLYGLVLGDAGGVSLWAVLSLAGILLLMLHSLVNAIYYHAHLQGDKK